MLPKTSRYRGNASLDAMLSLLPIIFLVSCLMHATHSIASKAGEAAARQETFDKIVSVADHTVKIGAARAENGVRHPNWVLPEKITGEYAEKMREEADLSSIHIGMDEPDGAYDFCIYRLVVVGDERAIGKIFVCGSG